MLCSEFERVLQERAGEPLPAEAQAHLAQCRSCSAVVADFAALQAAARELSAEEVTPPERVWVALRAQLVSEGLIREPERVAWFAGWLALIPRPALAGLSLAGILAAAVFLSLTGRAPRTPVATALQEPAAVASADRQLRSIERRTVLDLRVKDPTVTASLQRNLDIVDNFIALCEKSVREDPTSQMARDYLYGAYQQKANVLATAMDRSTPGD